MHLAPNIAAPARKAVMNDFLRNSTAQPGKKPVNSTPANLPIITTRNHPPAMNTHRTLLTAAALLVSQAASAADFTSTWNGTTGNWTDTSKWSTPGAPGTFPNNGSPSPTYDAVQSGGTLTVDLLGGITIQKFTLNRATMTAANDITFKDLLTVAAPGPVTSVDFGPQNTLNGVGVIQATGGIAWSALINNGWVAKSEISGVNTAVNGGRTLATDVMNVTGGMTISGAAFKSLKTRALNHGDGVNPTTANWSAGEMQFSDNAVFTNRNGATFNSAFDGLMANRSGANYFINQGIFTKSAGTGTTSINIVFDNSGTVNVDSGTLALNGGGIHSGSLVVPAGKGLSFSGGTHVWNYGTSFSGAGTVSQSNGTITVNSNVTLSGPLVLSAPEQGTSIYAVVGLLNGPGIINVPAGMTWSALGSPSSRPGSSEIRGANTTVVSGRTLATDVINVTGGLLINGTNIKSLNKRALNHGDGVNPSLASWTAGTLAISDAAVFSNKAGATFNTNFDGLIEHRGGAGSTFVNEGTFTKSGGTGSTVFSDNIGFFNSGTINVNSGTLEIRNGGGTHSGTVNISAGCAMNFNGGTHQFSAGASFIGAGTVRLSLGTLSVNNDLTIASPFHFNAPGPTTSLGGTRAFLNGAGVINVTGPMIWSVTNDATFGWIGTGEIVGVNTAVIGGRTMATDVINVTGGLTLNGTGIKILNGRALNHGDGVNPSTATWTAGNLATMNAGVFRNKAGATFDTNFNGLMEHRGGTAGTFINEGVFTKSGGTGSTIIQSNVGFFNSGTVNASSGSITFNGGYTQTAGALVLNGGGVSAGTFAVSGGKIQGGGTITGGVNVSSGVTIEPGIGSITGTLVITGDLTLTSGSRLDFNIGGTTPGTGHDRITEAGSAAFARTGLLVLTFANGYENSVQVADALNLITSNQTTTGQFSNVAAGRVYTADGYGSFAIISGTTAVTINGYAPSPEPARALVLSQQSVGYLQTPSNRWTFTGSAGQQVRLRAHNATAPGVAYTLTGPSGWVGFSYVSADSDLVSLPFSGTYNLGVVSLNSQAGGSYAFTLEETVQTSLTIGSTYTGSLGGSNQAQLFRITVTEPGALTLALQNAGLGNHVEIYLSRNVAPTPFSYEYADTGGPGADRSLNVSQVTPGEWYVLLYADQVLTPGSFTLDVSLATISLTSVAPGSQATNQPAVLTLYGAGFTPGTTAELVPASGSPIAASVQINSLTQLTATFAANSAAPGTYGVRVRKTNGDTAFLPGAFTSLAAGEGKLETKLIMPGILGRHAVATIYVEYANTGTAAMPAPLIGLVSSDTSTGERIYQGPGHFPPFIVDYKEKPILTLDSSRVVENYWSGTKGLPPGTSSEILFLGSGAQPGILAPGERIKIPVYYLGLLQPWNFEDNTVELKVLSWSANDTSDMEWDNRWYTLRPPSISEDAWEALRGPSTGTIQTTGGFIQMLSDNARFLHAQARRVTDVRELWAFEMLQAVGVQPRHTLAAALDASATVPGVSLAITRRYPNGIPARRYEGPFGRGWFCYWFTSLDVEDADNTVAGADVVRITSSEGEARTFTQDKRNGSYFPGPGDTTTLVFLGSDIYELRESDGRVTRFTAEGRVAYTEDTNGNRITASYDGSQRLTGLTHTAGASITLAYNGSGLISQVTTSEGRSATYAYTGTYLTSVTTDDGKTTSYTYLTTGPITTVHALASITAGGGTRHFTWDSSGRLASTSLGAGEEMSVFGYDNAGGVTISQGTDVRSLFFDHRGQVAKTIDPLGGISEAYYDENANLERAILPSGDQRHFAWFPNGRIKSVTDELGRITRMEYNHPLNRLTRLTDPNGISTNYSYDVKGNPLSTTYANGSTENWSAYTAAGLPGSRTNRRAQQLGFTFTSSGQLDRRTFPDGSYADFDYDARGNVVTLTEHPAVGADKITTFVYSPATDGDRLRRVTYPDGRSVDYFFDADGRRIRMTDSAGGDTRYEYDAVSRLSKLRDAANNVLVEYLYDAAGRLSRVNKGNGTATTYSYDAAGRLVLLANLAADESPHTSFAYTYDSRGSRLTATSQDGVWTYTYDATGQLTRAVLTSTNPLITNQDLRYNYDAAGNRISTLINGTATNYAINNLNQYTGIGGVPQLYDADGNLTSDGTNTYTYNTLNQLVQVSGPGGVTQHEYDAMGHRTATIVNGQRTDYLLDLTGIVHVLAEFDTSGLAARNLHGLGLVNRAAGGTTGWFDFDATGSVAAVRQNSGAVLNRYAFEPFGSSLLRTETMSNPFQFVGQFGVQTDADGGIFMRARHYQGRSGQFMQDDPIRLAGGDANLRRYVENDPTSFVDPRGTYKEGDSRNGPVADLGRWIGDTLGGLADGIGREEGAGGKYASALDEREGTYNDANSDLNNYQDHQDEVNNANQNIADQTGEFGKELAEIGKEGAKKGPGGFDKALGLFFDMLRGGGALRPPGGDQDGDGDSGVAEAVDPNDKLGPAGFGAVGWIAGSKVLPYRVNFENIGPGSVDSSGSPFPTFATAPAQRVTITDQLQAELDWDSFEWSEFGFGDVMIPVSSGVSHFTSKTSMTYNGQTFDVEIEAGINFNTGLVTVAFRSIDPATKLPPDVLTGFLPPEDGTGRGKGHIAYTVRAKSGLPTGTEIRNVASIRFDSNAIITTDQIDPQNAAAGTDPDKQTLITLDQTPPTSSVSSLSATTLGTGITVNWSGTDVGAGVADYDIYVSDNNGPWTLWLDNTAETTGRYSGQAGHSYAFFSVARDHAGLTETPSFTADATTVPQAFALMTISTTQGQPVAVNETKVAQRATSQLGVPATISSVTTPSTYGGAVVRDAGMITYLPAPAFTGTDTYIVTVSDGTSLVDGTVSVNVTAAPLGLNNNNPPRLEFLPGGEVRASFAGIPGRAYHLQRSINLGTWTTIGTTTADSTGNVVFTDSAPPQPTAFYRIAY
jgi:RHS repeat-associated protein